MLKTSVWHVWRTVTVVVLLAVCPSVSAQRISRIPVSSASVRILKEVPLSSEIPGILVHVSPTEEGQLVRKGDTMVRLKDDVIQAQYVEATRKAQSSVEIDFATVALEKAKIDLQVQNEQNSKVTGVAVFTPSEIRQSELEVKKAEAQLEKSTEDKILLELAAATKSTELAQFRIVSPIDGVVTQVHKWPGQAVRQGDPILTIMDLTTLRAVLYVDYSYRDQVLVGDEVELIITQDKSERRMVSAESADTGRPAKGGILENAPGLAKPLRSPERNPTADAVAPPRSQSAATPAAGPPAESAGERFTGVVTFIAPILSSGKYLEVYVNVPNRIDAEGRYLLQEGVGISAFILKK